MPRKKRSETEYIVWTVKGLEDVRALQLGVLGEKYGLAGVALSAEPLEVAKFLDWCEVWDDDSEVKQLKRIVLRRALAAGLERLYGSDKELEAQISAGLPREVVEYIKRQAAKVKVEEL